MGYPTDKDELEVTTNNSRLFTRPKDIFFTLRQENNFE